MSASMSACSVDHLTIISPTLKEGSAFVRSLLGVQPQLGGEHPRMGTHNLLLRLGESVFLEVIAIDPKASRPERARWFGLDQRSSDSRPHLGGWIARTNNIQASLSEASESLGQAEPMSRGALTWDISIPEDGSLPMGGAAPALIQWHTTSHPAKSMQDQGCRLTKLELRHPEPKRLNTLISSLRFDDPSVSLLLTRASVPCLVAHIDTPSGLRTIAGP